MARLLHLIDSLDPRAGGPVEYVKALGREHATMGHEVHAALLSRGEGSLEGIEIVRAGQKRGYGGYGFSPGLVGWLRKARNQYNGIFIHGLWQYHGLAARLAGVRCHVLPHGMLDPWFAGDRARHARKRLYWRLVEEGLLRRAEAVLFTSEAEARRAPRSFGRAWRREAIVGAGIAEPPGDVEGQREAFLAQYPQLAGRRVLLFLGRVDRKKGCELLARAFGELRPSGWTLVFAGPCVDAGYRAEIEAAARGDIVFTGMLEGAAKWGAFRGAEVFALPSHQENFGIAIAEALACGVPVLVSRAVDIHETITAAGAGFAESDDAAGTRALLERFLALEPATLAEMRAAAERCFRENFHIRRTAGRVLSLLEKGGPG